MFYSHQLLARKAPLGQIWMAATMHAKIHRQKLYKLDIIKICEEILNPSVPMALRLSGILMGGVVIVYERKVKLLYDDVTRLLVEINEAWKVKTAPSDPTRLPKGKSKAKYESVTLPANRDDDLGENEEESNHYSNETILDFQQTSYFAMRLDNVDDPFLNQNQGEITEDHHQADAANITINDIYDSLQASASAFNRYERFDIEGEDVTQLNPNPPEHTEFPSLVPSPPRPMSSPPHAMSSPPRPAEHHMPDEILEQHPEELVRQQAVESKETNLDQMRQRRAQKRANRSADFAMDYEQTIIPGHIYQSWLQNSSDIVSGRGRKRKRPMDAFSTMKIGTLTDLPSVVLVEKLITSAHKVHYPTPLLEQWTRSIQPPHDSPSAGQASHPQPPEPSSLSPPERMPFMEPIGDLFEEFQSRVEPVSKGISVEKQRANAHDNEIPPEIPVEDIRNNLKSNGFGTREANGVSSSNVNPMATPGNSDAIGDERMSIPSSGSHNSDVNSGRSAKKRPFSASKNSGNGLEPVAEELSWQNPEPDLKLTKPSGYEFTLDHEVLVETGPTQTQKRPVNSEPLDQITDSIRMYFKTHFDTPGNANVESLNQLALGMNRKKAAALFYQSCVLATRDYIRVEQREPYGDILISRGAKL